MCCGGDARQRQVCVVDLWWWERRLVCVVVVGKEAGVCCGGGVGNRCVLWWWGCRQVCVVVVRISCSSLSPVLLSSKDGIVIKLFFSYIDSLLCVHYKYH